MVDAWAGQNIGGERFPVFSLSRTMLFLASNYEVPGKER